MPDTKFWYLYMVRCRDGSTYTGITTNLKRRMREHRAGRGSKFIRGFGFSRLVYTERLHTKSQALRREAAIKRLSCAGKKTLIAGARRRLQSC